MSASVIHPEPRFIPASSEQALYDHVHALSVVIGSRSLREYGKIREAEQYIRTFLDKQEIPFELQGYDHEGNRYNNIVVTLEGGTRREETIIIGAHYDTVFRHTRRRRQRQCRGRAARAVPRPEGLQARKDPEADLLCSRGTARLHDPRHGQLRLCHAGPGSGRKYRRDDLSRDGGVLQ